MKNISFYNEDSNKSHKAPAKNFELWDQEKTPDETNKELEFHSQYGNVKIRVKNIDRDLIPEGFQESV